MDGGWWNDVNRPAESERIVTRAAMVLPRSGPPRQTRLALTCMGDADHVRMGRVEYVDVVDADDDVADVEARDLGRRCRFDGRHDDGPRPVDAESKLAGFSPHQDDIVAL